MLYPWAAVLNGAIVNCTKRTLYISWRFFNRPKFVAFFDLAQMAARIWKFINLCKFFIFCHKAYFINTFLNHFYLFLSIVPLVNCHLGMKGIWNRKCSTCRADSTLCDTCAAWLTPEWPQPKGNEANGNLFSNRSTLRFCFWWYEWYLCPLIQTTFFFPMKRQTLGQSHSFWTIISFS